MNIYVLGIAGAGVSALASILQSQGHRVSGSDSGVYPPVSTYLDRLGIPYFQDFDAAHVPAALDLAILGTTAKLGPANPERAEIARRGVPASTFAAYLGELTRARETLVVAGSFGKSTLTAMIAHLLRAAGRDPGYFIGAVPLDLDRTGFAGSDPDFILEGDEYVVSLEDRRPKFALYHPRHVLISSIVHDHVNMFPTPEIYEALFAQLIAQAPREGLLVCAHAYPALQRLTAGRDVVWYGVDPCPGYYARDVAIAETTRFRLVGPKAEGLELATPLLGLHNVENIVGACAYLLERGLVSPETLAEGVARFRGVARRLDKKTARSRAPVYEGFGSSFEKARSAVEAIRLHFPARPLIVVFEPHTFSWRNAEALAWYDAAFVGVDLVLALPPPDHGAQSHAQLSHDQIVARINAAGIKAIAMANGADVHGELARIMTGDEVVLLLSSGPLDGLADTLPAALDARFAPAF
jgi:UDP-N-acetylmuramate: L-alanyl-gamma-D-glutamyl-meso-diaminopimelate ligase